MVVDVGRQERPVAPAENHLLAPVRGAPIHFHPQLVGLDQPGRLAQPLAHLRQEEHESVRPGPVARERGVGLRRGTPAVARRTSASAAGAFQLCASERGRVGEDQHHRRTDRTSHARTSHAGRGSMTGISRRRWGPASWLCLGAAVLAAACGGRARPKTGVDPSAPRVVPLAVGHRARDRGPAALRHHGDLHRRPAARHRAPARPPRERRVRRAHRSRRAPFAPTAGGRCKVEVRPRPGVYGLDVITACPSARAPPWCSSTRATSPRRRARAPRYGSDVLYERALAVGQYRPGGAELALLPSTRSGGRRPPVGAAGGRHLPRGRARQ